MNPLEITQKYGVIYADPPWSYSTWKDKKSRTADSKYPTMTLEHIAGMAPMINQLADDNCALFLWATNPLLPDAIATMAAWGFRYVSVGFYWVKTTKAGDKVRMGMGHYTRPGCELCLLGMRGKMPVSDKGVHQVLHAVQRKHSQKPDQIYNRISRLYPDAPKIELFARQQVKGWDCWGNEVNTVKLPPFEGSVLARQAVKFRRYSA
jgi:site-specific DNA-methyltransferase (adenine-specific)